MSRRPSYAELVERYKRELLAFELHAAGGNRSKAARALQMERTYLQRLIREHRIRVPAPRRKPS